MELLAPLVDLMEPVNLVSRSRLQQASALFHGNGTKPGHGSAKPSMNGGGGAHCQRTNGHSGSSEEEHEEDASLTVETFVIASEFGIQPPCPQAQDISPFEHAELLQPMLSPSTRELQNDISPWPSTASHRFHTCLTKQGLQALLFVMVGALEIDNERVRVICMMWPLPCHDP